MTSPKIIVIIGPTAVGKTKLSIELAKKLDTEIISADSMQIYKSMNIGTAKVTADEMENVKHHMINLINPNEEFSVSEFQKKSSDIIYRLQQNNKIPIVVGGSGLYVNSLIYDLDFSKAKGDKTIREYYQKLFEEKGVDALHKKLIELDPIAAQNIHKNNVKRVIRALEVYEITGKPYSQLNNNFRKENRNYECIIIGLTMQRDILYERINCRVDKMLELGLIEEVKDLLESGYSNELVSMQGLGYKEIVSYINGEISKEEAIRILKRDTRRFAKRQFTWFSKDNRIKWFEVKESSNYEEMFYKIYEYVQKRIKED